MYEGCTKDDRRKPHPTLRVTLPKYLRDLGREKPTSEPVGTAWLQTNRPLQEAGQWRLAACLVMKGCFPDYFGSDWICKTKHPIFIYILFFRN